jgi:redox-sensitive bicupin YhaK (pirin superfamily)
MIPTVSQPVWTPFHLVSEGIAARERHLPAHAHDREEVVTYLIEGSAAYKLEGRPAERLPQGSARLLTAGSREIHEVSPSEGASIRWFNLVVGLPRSFTGPSRLQATGSSSPKVIVDEVEVRRLTGPNGPMVSASGLECDVMAFPQECTTFRRVGAGRRAIVYALAGRGTVDERSVEAGEIALVDGAPALSIGGSEGFRAIFAVAGVEPAGVSSGLAGSEDLLSHSSGPSQGTGSR